MPIPRRAPAGLAALLAGASGLAAQPAPAAPPLPAQEEEPTECWTIGLTEEEVAAGETSVVHCDTPLPRRRSTLVAALHYSGVNGLGTPLQVLGDCSTRVAFDVNDWWNNRISSTRFTICGNVKHFVSDDWSGTNQLLTGTAGQVDDLNATLDNQTSSIGYG